MLACTKGCWVILEESLGSTGQRRVASFKYTPLASGAVSYRSSPMSGFSISSFAIPFLGTDQMKLKIARQELAGRLGEF